VKNLLVPAFCALALAAGCSSASSSSSAGDDGGVEAPAGSNLQTVSFQMKDTVAAGQEVFKCQLVTLPNVNAWMVHGEHDYTPGSHHMLLFTTDYTSIPTGADQVQDCYEGASSNVMSHIRGLIYGGQTPTGSEQFPPGVGLVTSPNQILLFQVHYLNSTSAPLDAEVNVKLTLDSGTDVTTNAGVLFFYDPFIDVPAGAKAKASMRCLIPRDITLLSAQSHYHARGVGYSAFLDADATHLAPSPFYTSASWSSPALMTMNTAVKGGSHIRFGCDYDNSTGTQEFFQGPSAATNEMCMFIGTYYPDLGALDDFCEAGPDYFGTGSATCGDTLSCASACGTPSLSSDCMQKCVVQSCPLAATALVPLLKCEQSSCSSPCKNTASSECTTCLKTSCASTYTGCTSQACQ